jgi:hypothetical protein
MLTHQKETHSDYFMKQYSIFCHAGYTWWEGWQTVKAFGKLRGNKMMPELSVYLVCFIFKTQ